jgi:hypothetical protein
MRVFLLSEMLFLLLLLIQVLLFFGVVAGPSSTTEKQMLGNPLFRWLIVFLMSYLKVSSPRTRIDSSPFFGHVLLSVVKSNTSV